MKKIVLILIIGLIAVSPSIGEIIESSTPSEINNYDGWRFEYVNMDDVWGQLDKIPYLKDQKNEVIVAVIDTGVDMNHPDLNITDTSYDFYDNDNNPSDGNGHGTHVAGIIGAKKNNGDDNVVGIAPGVQIMALKVTDSSGYFNSFLLGDAINYAVANGADVINISLQYSLAIKSTKIALENAQNSGVVIVAGTGNFSNHWEDGEIYNERNSGKERYIGLMRKPAMFNSVISVGAVAINKNTMQIGIADYSGVAGIIDGEYSPVDVLAPGSGIWSSKKGDSSTGIIKSGTSMASPHVAGMVALIKGKYPDLTALEIEEIIKKTANDSQIIIPSDYNGVKYDKVDIVGSGLIDINAALNFSPLNALSINESSSFKFDPSKYDYLVNVDRGVTELNFICDAMEGTTFYVNGTTQSNLCNLSMPLTDDITFLQFDVELSGVRRTYKFFVKYNQPFLEGRINRIIVDTPLLNPFITESEMNYYVKIDPQTNKIDFRLDTFDASDKIAMVSFDSVTDYIYDEKYVFPVDLPYHTTVLGFKVKTLEGKITTYLMAIIKEQRGLNLSPYDPLDPIIITSRVNIKLDTDAIVLDYGLNADPVFTSYEFKATVTGADKNEVVWTLDNDEFVTVDNGLVTVKENVADGSGDFSVKLTAQSVVGGAVAQADILFVERTPLGSVEFLAPYISGYADGTFRPKNSITRGEVATIFSKILNLNTQNLGEQKFSDVSSEHWAYPYVQTIFETGIFSGYEDGRFLPDKPIKRSEIAQVFTNYWDYYKLTVNATHVIKIPDVADDFWAADPIHRMYNARIFPGYLNNAYRPHDDTLREELVYMVNKLIAREPLDVEVSQFSDIKSDDYYLGEIEAASQFYVNKNNLKTEE